MSKKIKVLLIGGIVLLVLIAALVVLLVMQNQEESGTPSGTPQSSINLVENNINNVSEVTVTNDSGTFVIEQPEDGVFKVDKLEDLPTGQKQAKSVVSSLAVIDALRVVSETPGDLEEYGLKEPKVTGRISLKDGSSYTLKMGIKTPLNEGYYAMLEGDEKLYLLNSGIYKDFYELGAKDYLDLVIADIEEAEEAKDAVRKLTLKREDFKWDLVFEQLENDPEASYSPMYSSDFVMTEPVKAFIDGGEFENVASAVFDLKVSSVVQIFPSEEDLRSYGLDEPQTILTAEMIDGSEVTILVGNACYKDPATDEKEGTTVTGYYLQLVGRDAVYYAKTSQIPFHTDSMFSILSQIAFAPSITSLDAMTVTAEGVDYDFDFTQKEDGDKISTSATINGNAVDDTKLTNFYIYLVSALADDLHPDEPAGDPILTIRFTFLDSSVEPLTVEFHDVGDRKASISINGQVRFETRYNYVAMFFENIKAIAANENINPNY